MFARRGFSQIPQEERVNFFRRRRYFPACVWRRGDKARKWRYITRPLDIPRVVRIDDGCEVSLQTLAPAAKLQPEDTAQGLFRSDSRRFERPAAKDRN